MTTPEKDKGTPGGEIPTAAIVALVLLAVVGLGSVVVLEVLGKPTDRVMLMLTVLLVPSSLQLLQSRRNRAVLDSVHTKVNGRLDGLLTDRALLEEQLRANGLVPVTVPQPRLTTETSDVAAVQGGAHRGEP